MSIVGEVSTSERFLRIGGGDAAWQLDIEARLRRGEVAVERLHATNGGNRIEIPSGMVHRWVGAVFVPRVRVGPGRCPAAGLRPACGGR